MSLSSITTYQKYVKDATKLEQKFEKTSGVQKDIDYFNKAVDKLKSVDDLFKDQRLVSFLAKALNLSGEEQYPGKMKRILTEKVDDKNAVMNRLSSKQYKNAAESLQLGESGLARLKLNGTKESMAWAYKNAKFEESIGDENLAVRQARYFEKWAASAASSPYNVLGDPILREVVTYAVGLPKQIAVQPVETQAKAITDRVDIKKFSDAKFRENFIKKFLNKHDLEDVQASGGSGGWLTSLFTAGSDGSTGVNIVI
ncbi:DUF1217 domain-containing protein [Azospirillum sp. TSO22-1]|uniref:DUF1217 domain-containing protein n=1 Tax=Azospirillum sp. TSO22-1 TaxID=716789 RepID=UPI000D6198E4|nr:DUF1217 domain-containing protein [Azospirillum sp. TSO22-1]PWC54970.1 hypothetical protein TSO221_06450 [Azospirillum sp. TSO22-1]